MGFGKLEGLGVTFGGQAIDDGTTGIRQTHDLGTLVKGLTRCIVDGLSQHLHIARRIDFDNLGVAPADEQAQVRKLRHLGIGFLLDKMGEHMTMQVVHVNKGDVKRQGQALRERSAHMERAGQARPTRESNGVDVFRFDASLTDSLADNGHDVLLMGTRCQLGHHAAVGLMHPLAGNHIT